jgi:flagellar hook-associated protein FlgK
MVARTREIGRMAAELEARAELLHEERDDVVRHLSDVLGASMPEAPDNDDEFLPPPAP